MEVWKQIFRFLRPTRPFSPQPDPPNQPISPHLGRLEIPTEIILMIAKHLDKPSLLCLALTCQTLKRYCFPESLDLSSSEQSEFLLLLEKDAAKYYFCHFCVKLHPWHASWFEGAHSLNRDFYSKDVYHCKMRNWFNMFALGLPYSLARVVMNRHFYGAAHGACVDELACRREFTYQRYGLTYSRDWRARIIDDQLMLSSIMTLGPLRDSEGLRAAAEADLAAVCHHITTDVLFSHHQIPEQVLLGQVLLGSQPDHITQRLQSVNSCPICMTDYCIDIHWQETGWTIEIITYHMLGDMRSPWDWTWIAIVYMPDKAVRIPRFKQPSESQPGIVKHMWSKSDDDIFHPRGEWVTVTWHPLRFCLSGSY